MSGEVIEAASGGRYKVSIGGKEYLIRSETALKQGQRVVVTKSSQGLYIVASDKIRSRKKTEIIIDG